MKKTFVGILILLLSINIAFGAMYQENTTDTSSSGNPETANFIVETLKYEPYPVNAGDWFDVWIKVQNVGQADALNARFELIPDYPFSSSEKLVKDYGLILGSKNGYKVDADGHASEVVIKYRVKAADNAPEGISNLKFIATADTTSAYSTKAVKDLPIVIGKTKTDFEVVMQDSTTQGTSFAIANTGENAATAVSISLKEQEGLTVNGPQASIVGNLDTGDFTTVTFPIAPNKELKEVTIQVAYTDTAGVRNTLEKTIPVVLGSTTTTFGNGTVQKQSSMTKYYYGIAGLVIGIILVLFLKRKKKK